ncbi:MAG: RNA polymerase sporulation sigma factor SigK [Bacilli bacterium]|nr:RNA polymerase sporulation sigma factor SigK [Bacilli bacterium]
MFCFTGSYGNTTFPEPLSKEDEEKYIDLMINKKDKNARNILIEHNLRLVPHIVKKYNVKNENDDLISIGIIGLIKGIDSFSNKKGSKLTTYAARCIDNEILMYFRNNKKNNQNVSLEENVGYDKDGNEISLLDILKTPNIDYVEDINIKNNINLLTKYINILSEREKIIIYKRYGLFNYDELTQKEIAKELNISRSYVSRIEKRALTKLLREFLKNKEFEK